MKGKIPFTIELTEGNYMVVPVRFISGRTINLKYQFICRAKGQRLFCFRSGRDAMLAARHNGWVYLGKVK